MNDVLIRYPETTNGVRARGPYSVGKAYSVPEDVAGHLTNGPHCAERIAPGYTGEVAANGTLQVDNFVAVREVIKANGAANTAPQAAAPKDDAPKSNTKPADAGAK